MSTTTVATPDGDEPSVAPFDVTALQIEKLDPKSCHPYAPNEKIYGKAEDSLDDEFLASIRYWGGNLRPGYVTRSGEGYVVRAGHRRLAACFQLGLPFSAVVLDDLPAPEVDRLAMEDNITQRHRDEVTRMLEALEAEGRIRDELAGRRRRGRGGKLEEGEEKSSFEARVSAEFFEGNRREDHIRKLYAIVTSSLERGPIVAKLQAVAPLDGETILPTEQSLAVVDKARKLVDQLRQPDRTGMTVRMAYAQLTAERDKALGIPPPAKSPEQIDEALDRAVVQFLGQADQLRRIAEVVKPWASMTPEQTREIRGQFTHRDWGKLARIYPWAVRVMADMVKPMNSGQVRARGHAPALGLVKRSMDEDDRISVAAALIQIAEAIAPSPLDRHLTSFPVTCPAADVEEPPINTDTETNGASATSRNGIETNGTETTGSGATSNGKPATAMPVE